MSMKVEGKKSGPGPLGGYPLSYRMFLDWKTPHTKLCI